MNWLISAAIFATVLVASVQATPATGTCASIGYSTQCCYPPGNNCQATDGDCNCGSDCHEYGDCCQDVHCPSNPRICADVGITECCNDATNMGLCEVHHRDSQRSHCSCNVSCHLRNDCCSDAEEIGCVPRTCAEAGNHPGCCMWTYTKSCFVQGGRCYCDSYCTYFNDCCRDVSSETTLQCAAAQLSRSKVQSNLERALKSSTVRTFHERDNRKHTQNAADRSAYNRATLSAYKHRQRMNPKREFRSRAHHVD